MPERATPPTDASGAPARAAVRRPPGDGGRAGRARRAPRGAPERRRGRRRDVDLVERARGRLRPSLRRVLNATGVIVHTNLGRAPLADEARAAVARAAEGYANLEFDLEDGERGSRQDHVEALLRELTGADAALAVNNCAAATLLAAAALAAGRELVVSRGQLDRDRRRVPDPRGRGPGRRADGRGRHDEPHAAVRLRRGRSAPDTAARSCAPTRRTSARSASSRRSRSRRSAALGVPVIDDVGSGVLADDLPALADEPAVRRSVRAGAAVVCFSGDKLLGGPQAGLLVGERDAIAACRRHPLARAVRIDKLSLAALEATLRLYRDPAHARGGDPGARDARRRPGDPRRPRAAPRRADRRARSSTAVGPGRRRRAAAARAGGPRGRARPRPGRAPTRSPPPCAPATRRSSAASRTAASCSTRARSPTRRPTWPRASCAPRADERRAATSAPLTLGTAGHIDHGKTALVAALTGVDTDRLPEEKARGISIALGYAQLALPSGRRLSVVDVPGHERFVRTMVAGATGVDLYLMVVAADDGVMPQTIEHAAVLPALGVTDGRRRDHEGRHRRPRRRPPRRRASSWATSRSCRARPAPAWASPRSRPRSTGSPRAPAEPRRRGGGETLLHVDRSFTIRGAGTVVTGTLWSGSVARGDVLALLPRGVAVRVRGVQVHDEPVERAEAGQRVALNLAGHRPPRRSGAATCSPPPDAVAPTHASSTPRSTCATPTTGCASTSTTARARRRRGWRRSATASGSCAWRGRCSPARGDRVVVRSVAPPDTLGGGIVLDPHARRHGPRPDLVARLERLRRGEPEPEPAPAEPPAPARGARARGPAAVRAPRSRSRRSCAPPATSRRARPSSATPRPRSRRSARPAGRCASAARCTPIPTRSPTCATASWRSWRPRAQITLARLRDELDTSRKFAQALLEHLDAARVTRRRPDDTRVLRRHAR